MADQDVRAVAPAANARRHDHRHDHGVTCTQGCPTQTQHESRPDSLGAFDPAALISARGLGFARNGRVLIGAPADEYLSMVDWTSPSASRS